MRIDFIVTDKIFTYFLIYSALIINIWRENNNNKSLTFKLNLKLLIFTKEKNVIHVFTI